MSSVTHAAQQLYSTSQMLATCDGASLNSIPGIITAIMTCSCMILFLITYLLTFTFFFFLNNPAPPEISPFPLPAPFPTPGENLRHRHAFVLGLVRKHRPGDHVADGVNAGHVGLVVRVHDHPAAIVGFHADLGQPQSLDRKSTRLNSSHSQISYAVFCLKKK